MKLGVKRREGAAIGGVKEMRSKYIVGKLIANNSDLIKERNKKKKTIMNKSKQQKTAPPVHPTRFSVLHGGAKAQLRSSHFLDKPLPTRPSLSVSLVTVYPILFTF